MPRLPAVLSEVWQEEKLMFYLRIDILGKWQQSKSSLFHCFVAMTTVTVIDKWDQPIIVLQQIWIYRYNRSAYISGESRCNHYNDNSIDSLSHKYARFGKILLFDHYPLFQLQFRLLNGTFICWGIYQVKMAASVFMLLILTYSLLNVPGDDREDPIPT